MRRTLIAGVRIENMQSHVSDPIGLSAEKSYGNRATA